MCLCYVPTMWWPYCQLRPVFCQYVQLSVGAAKLESCQFEPGLLLNVRNDGGITFLASVPRCQGVIWGL
jgi:hypothetical protein